MKTEEKPIPVNRIKAVLAEKQITAKQLCLQLQEIALYLDVDVRELLCSTK